MVYFHTNIMRRSEHTEQPPDRLTAVVETKQLRTLYQYAVDSKKRTIESVERRIAQQHPGSTAAQHLTEELKKERAELQFWLMQIETIEDNHA